MEECVSWSVSISPAVGWEQEKELNSAPWTGAGSQFEGAGVKHLL